MTRGLAERAGALLDRRMSRRGMLARMGLGATALSIAPVRFALRPGTAEAVIHPKRCGPTDRCNDGYTAFCCEINAGRNVCPPHSYVAGWWKCTRYKGKGLCGDQGFRYYVDCNRTPGEHFPGGCRCGPGGCDSRRVDCNHFRYGQCNTQVDGITEVACRLVVCEHPATVPGFNCNRTYKEDDNTCVHDSGCLEPVVQQYPGGGGA